MRVLIDTNVLLDFLMGRKPYFDIADQLIKLCADRKMEGYMAAHSVPNIYYVLRKCMSDVDRREVLKFLCQIIKIEGLDFVKIYSAVDNKEFSDFEDCLQEECAVAVSADYIVTRNIKDFVNSKIPAVLPDDLLKKVNIKE